jgi:hypothetical protein
LAEAGEATKTRATRTEIVRRNKVMGKLLEKATAAARVK